MKKSMTLLVILTIVTVLGIHVSDAVAENQYEITWSTIDTGQTTSMGGSYELWGTTGQHDTGISGSDVYTFNSGFWPDIRSTCFLV